MAVRIAGLNGACKNSSCRCQSARTGRPAPRAIRAASSATSSELIVPRNTPPQVRKFTVIFSTRWFNTRASDALSAKTFWLCAQTVRASPSHCATAQDGPIDAWLKTGLVRVMLTSVLPASRFSASYKVSLSTIGPSSPSIGVGITNRNIFPSDNVCQTVSLTQRNVFVLRYH